MPKSCRAILKKCLQKGAITQEEYDKVERNLPRWIPCAERLPKEDEAVLVYLFDDPPIPYIAWVFNKMWATDDFILDEDEAPTHWMPLPKGEI